ncbi:MAG: hypothetical protein FD167_280 [bacterium]|nr:MAG: hypothetical protein FD167_280 [bacterium]
MVYLEISSSNKKNNKRFYKTKLLKEQENIKLNTLSDNQNSTVEQEYYSTLTTKQSFCDYLVVYDLEEKE